MPLIRFARNRQTRSSVLAKTSQVNFFLESTAEQSLPIVGRRIRKVYRWAGAQKLSQARERREGELRYPAHLTLQLNELVLDVDVVCSA